VLGQEIGFLIQQYPNHRNVTLRLIEPLGAPEGAVNGSHVPSGGAADIRLEEVVVRAAGHDILTVDELHLEPGSHVAVVGTSGGGKTTLAGLLLGWHEPTAGRVLVDGQPLQGAALAALRRQTVWVEPGVYLWNRSLLENLRYGANGGSVGAAIAEADLDEVLGRLPIGLQTPLGEGGALLSGGEGQRVRFGRGVLRGAGRLVVLDEAFRGLERDRRAALLARGARSLGGEHLPLRDSRHRRHAHVRARARDRRRPRGRGRRSAGAGHPGRLPLPRASSRPTAACAPASTGRSGAGSPSRRAP
jgi:ATP-binding cassette subfamily B protein